MNLEEQLAQAVKLVEDVKAQIAANKELKPFDWKGQARHFVSAAGDVHFVDISGYPATKLFYSKSRDEAERFAHKLSILSCINNLKKTLGCNWEFTADKTNHEIGFCANSNQWVDSDESFWNTGTIYFESKEDARKVCDYLNKAYPNGWALPQQGGA